MEVKALRKERRELEKTLAVTIGKHLTAFRRKTGFSPRSINVSLTEVTIMGEAEPDYDVSGVAVDIPL